MCLGTGSSVFWSVCCVLLGTGSPNFWLVCCVLPGTITFQGCVACVKKRLDAPLHLWWHMRCACSLRARRQQSSTLGHVVSIRPYKSAHVHSMRCFRMRDLGFTALCYIVLVFVVLRYHFHTCVDIPSFGKWFHLMHVPFS